ncbi:MAG: MotA/TolQ/ExbB proton channel family protein [Desulfobacteraceae bacterium]|jgi:biopolymer transport protein ExbB
MVNEQIVVFSFFAARIILGLLLFISVLSVAFFIERMIFFRRHLMKDITALRKQIDLAQSAQDIIKIMKSCKRAETDIIFQSVKDKPISNEIFLKRVDSFFYPEKERWSRYTTFLGSVGSNAPFIGLLGTVFGILKAFADLSLSTTGGPQVVMAGISEALVATAVGLLVAIPAVVFYNICKVRVKKSVVNLQSMTALICAKNIFNRPAAKAASGQHAGSKLTSLYAK